MALQIFTPGIMTCQLSDKNIGHLICYNTRKTAEISAERSYDTPTNIFEEQIDMTSEIMSFLDVESLLKVCQASKVFRSCLRHDHVITSALSTASPLRLNSTSLPITPGMSKSMFALEKEKKPQQNLQKKEQQRDEQHCRPSLIVEQTSEYTIMKRLLQVYEKYNSLKSSTSNDSAAQCSLVIQNVERPSPMRLLRLVNAKKCEKCNRRLAPSSNGGSLVLPSLTFGKFCCTKCLFK